MGNSGYQGSTVRACAQAEWGAPAAATTDALTISACEWDQATQQGTLFAPAPPYPQIRLPAQYSIRYSRQTPATAAARPSQLAPTGQTSSAGRPIKAGNCTLPVSGSFPAAAGPRRGMRAGAAERAAEPDPDPGPCLRLLNAGAYTLQGFADFVVTGYNLPGFEASDWLEPGELLPGRRYCLNGYFVQGVIPATGSITGPNLGVSVIDLTG